MRGVVDLASAKERFEEVITVVQWSPQPIMAVVDLFF